MIALAHLRTWKQSRVLYNITYGMFHSFAVQKQTTPLWYAMTGSKERHKNINKEGTRVKSKRMGRTTSDPRFESPPGDNDRVALQAATACLGLATGNYESNVSPLAASTLNLICETQLSVTVRYKYLYYRSPDPHFTDSNR